jgi:mannosylglycerate synthase
VSLVVFPFKQEDPAVVGTNLATASGHERVDEVWAVAASPGAAMDEVEAVAAEISLGGGSPISVFPQARLGGFRSGKGDGMNTALALAAERAFSRVHFYDADIINFDTGWIDGAERAADRGYGVVRHRFPRAATDAMITWMVTRPGLALLFPGTMLPRLGQPLGGELLLTGDVVEALAEDDFVVARSDWGVDTVLTHATSVSGAAIYEHNAPDGKRHALYGALTDIEEMMLECLDAVASLRGRASPATGFDADPPAGVPADLKETVAYDLESTRSSISAAPGPAEAAILSDLGVDPSRPITMDGETWRAIFPELLDRFRLDDRGWRSAAFRLWVERVIHYTTHQVPQGYDATMAYLEQTIVEFEKST